MDQEGGGRARLVARLKGIAARRSGPEPPDSAAATDRRSLVLKGLACGAFFLSRKRWLVGEQDARNEEGPRVEYTR
jgi:hypothetical protein